MYRFGLFGSDKRTITVKEKLQKDGYSAKMLGYESDFDGLDVIILPFGCDFERIKQKCKGKKVFAPFDADGCENYLKNRYFKTQNAIPSAEGAVWILMSNSQRTVCGMQVGVVGSGCIAKELVRILGGLGATVTVYARNQKGDADITDLDKFNGDALFNTVPAPVVTKSVLCNYRQKPTIIDVSSLPGGVDFDYAAICGIKCMHELGIPSRYAPETAGEILKNTVLSMLEV